MLKLEASKILMTPNLHMTLKILLGQLQQVVKILTVWEEWKLTMQGILVQHAPCRTKRFRNNPFSWINSEVKHQMYARDLLKKKATKSNSPTDWLLFRQKRNAVNQLVRKTKKQYYQDEIKKNLGSPKGTWRVLNNIMGNKAKNN